VECIRGGIRAIIACYADHERRPEEMRLLPWTGLEVLPLAACVGQRDLEREPGDQCPARTVPRLLGHRADGVQAQAPAHASAR
jgi:hypothetical protein